MASKSLNADIMAGLFSTNTRGRKFFNNESNTIRDGQAVEILTSKWLGTQVTPFQVG
jgi:hypothetical protein